MFRLETVPLSLLVTLLACVTASAQGHTQATAPAVCRVQVRVTYSDEHPVGRQIRVNLVNGEGVPVEQAFTDGEGQALFQITGGGVYRAQASGPDIEEAVSDAVTIDPQDRMAMIWLHVKQKAVSGAPSSHVSSSPVTTANALRIPAAAKKFFMQGLEALYRHEYRNAAEQFEKATIAYPQYDSAYDNLGATYMQLGETAKARAAFERAVQLNDKNADAERNYARLLLTDEDYSRAIELLNKALVVEPQDPGSLTLLAIAQLRTGNVDAALQDAMRVNQFPHEGYAVAHYIAGRAYELKQQYPDATTQYEAYLQETPNGPEVQQVHAALARVTASARKGPQSGAAQ